MMVVSFKALYKTCSILFRKGQRPKYSSFVGLSKKVGKDQESIKSSITPDPGYQ